jgi:uncharacterized OB-fold protein
VTTTCAGCRNTGRRRVGRPDLEEGTRITAELKDCDPEAVDFGMAVTAFIHEDEDGFRIPMFRPAAKGGV